MLSFTLFNVALLMITPHTLVKRKKKLGTGMNIDITVCRYGTFTDIFDKHIFKYSNKKEHVAKERILKFMFYES